LLILDGLEPLQNPPGQQEGRVREPSLQALLRELAAFNTGLCVITTRLPVADIVDHVHTSAPCRNLEQLSNKAGAQLLQALGVSGNQEELRSASDEFSGHCLALTLLGSYLTDAYNGDIRCRKEVSERLSSDVREGAHARKVMESYQSWFHEGPELAVLRLLGLFDRPVDEEALRAVLKSPAIPNLTEYLSNLSPSEWRTILARLRRTRLLADEDPHHSGQLDTHPLVREYFGRQLRSQRADAWKECNARLYNHYRTLAPQLPDSFREMEPLFLAVICGCNAGLFRDALHEVYIPRIQRGNASFAAKVIGARAALLSVLSRFFEDGCWGCPAETAVEGQSLSAEDQLFILLQAGLYIIATRGFSAPEVRICYAHMESLCHLLNRPLVLFSALEGQWRYSLVTDKLTTTMQIARRAYSLAQEQNNSALMLGAYRALAVTLYFLGDFETAHQYSMSGVQVWRSGGVEPPVEEISALCTRQSFALWLAGGEVLRGWARSASASVSEGLSWIEDGIKGWRATGSIWVLPYFLALKAEALHLADRSSEALETIKEAQALAERSEEHWWRAEMHRLRGVFLATLRADEAEIEASFCEAIRTAGAQKSASLAARAEATYEEYRRRKER
jgi:hypothetical protein